MSIRAIAAIGLAAAALPALAQLPPATTDHAIDLAGSTASDGAIQNRFTLKEGFGGICDGSSEIFFLEGTDDDVYTLICSLNDDGVALFPGTSAGDTVRVSKGGGGGSQTGCGPVADGTPQGFIPLEPSRIGNECDPASVEGGSNPDAEVVRYRNCPTDDQRVAVAGFSDVECGLLGATPGQLANLDQFPGFQVIFGVPVSLNLYRGLQVCQGLNPASDDASEAPSLPQALISSIYTGGILLWNQINCDPNGDGTVDFNLDTAIQTAGFPSLGLGGAVNIMRRVETSGTQTFAEIWSARENCTTGVPLFRSEASCDTGGRDCASEIEGGSFSGGACCNSGSGDVRDALGACTDASIGCIGVLSTDSFDNVLTDADEQARFVKVNGYFPSLCNVAEGNYDFVSLNTAQTVAGLNNVLEPIVTAVNGAEDVADINAGICDDTIAATGRCTGFMADPSGGNTAVATVCQELNDGSANDVIFNPTSRYTRASLGAPNNCQPYRSIFTLSDTVTLSPEPNDGDFGPRRRRNRR